MKYFIQTEQKNYLKGLTQNNLQEVVEDIIFYDLQPPFVVLNENNEDKTTEALKMLKDIRYNFVDKSLVAKCLPSDLRIIMNKFYGKSFFIDSDETKSAKLVAVEDIKSIKGFYDLWENKCISIGRSGNDILFFDTNDETICLISDKAISLYPGTRHILFKNSNDFIKLVKIKIK